MKKKIIILILLMAVILIGKSEAAILTQKLGSEYIETTVEENEAVTMTFVSKKGFRFKNWVLIEGDIEINTTSEEINFDMPNTNVTIEAKYDTTYLITFNSNDGTDTTTSMNITAGATEKLTKNTFIRSGYRFTGWSDATNGDVIYEDEENCTPNKDLILYAIWEVNEVTVKFESNGGSEVSSITVIYGGTYGELSTPTKSGYTFSGWYKEAGLENEVTSETEVTVSTTHILYAKWKLSWNEPILGTGMKAVNWNGSSWTTLNNTSSWDYNYTMATAGTTTIEGDGTARWANAVIDADNNGVYESYYVWIPRFTYKITEGNRWPWNTDESPGTGKTEIKFSDGTDDYTTGDYSGYSKHSAFTLKDKNGNVVKELTGFWIAKFEASLLSGYPSSRPGVASSRNTSASGMFNYGKTLNSGLGSHMLKDSEWEAVASLTSAIGRIPYINNSYTYSTGNAGTSEHVATYVNGVANAYDTVKGVKASTTHNIYGVYDMSGGAYECTAAYYNVSTSSYIGNLTSSYNSNGQVYVDYYTTAEPFGPSTGYRFGDLYSCLLDQSPVPLRGGYFDDGSDAGIFKFQSTTGQGNKQDGFRVALWGFSL